MLSLLALLGVLILVSGVWLAHAGIWHLERQKSLDHIAGFLIIAGLSCIGAVLGLLFDLPLP